MGELETKRTRLVSKSAPGQLRAARSLTLMGLVFFSGAFMTLVALLLGPSTASVILASIGATMACTACLGFYAYGKVYNGLLGIEDIVEVSKREDPATAGPPRVAIGQVKKGIAGKRLVVGPVRLTVAQYRLIASTSKKLGWKWARQSVWVDSGANVSNVNQRYGTMTSWMLDNGFIEDTSNNPSRPTYYVTEEGQEMLTNAGAGKAPVDIMGE